MGKKKKKKHISSQQKKEETIKSISDTETDVESEETFDTETDAESEETFDTETDVESEEMFDTETGEDAEILSFKESLRNIIETEDDVVREKKASMQGKIDRADNIFQFLLLLFGLGFWVITILKMFLW